MERRIIFGAKRWLLVFLATGVAGAAPLAGGPVWRAAFAPPQATSESYERSFGKMAQVKEAWAQTLRRYGEGILLTMVMPILALMVAFTLWHHVRKSFEPRRTGRNRPPMSFPDERGHQVVFDGLPVPFDFAWDYPDLVVDGTRYNVLYCKRVKGADKTWVLQNGKTLSFVKRRRADGKAP